MADNIIDFEAHRRKKAGENPASPKTDPKHSNAKGDGDDSSFEMGEIFGDDVPDNDMARMATALVLGKVARMAITISLLREASNAIERAGLNPNEFEMDEFTFDSFINMEPDDGEPSEEHPERMWNGPHFDAYIEPYDYCVASTVIFHQGLPDAFSVDVFRIQANDECWELWHDGKWVPGPQEDIFETFEAVREGRYDDDDDDEDEDEDEDDDWFDDDDFEALLAEGRDSIYNLDIKMRTLNTLKNEGIDTISELCEMTEIDLLTLSGIGPGSLKDIKEALKERGLSLKQFN